MDHRITVEAVEQEILSWAISWVEAIRTKDIDDETWQAIDALVRVRRMAVDQVKARVVPDVHPCLRCGTLSRLQNRPRGHRLWCSTTCQDLWREDHGLTPGRVHRGANQCEVCSDACADPFEKFNAGLMCLACQSELL